VEPWQCEDFLCIVLYTFFFFFFWCSAVYSRSMTPITGQATVDDKEQDALAASSKQPSMGGGRRQLSSKNSGHCCKTSSKQLSMLIMYTIPLNLFWMSTLSIRQFPSLYNA